MKENLLDKLAWKLQPDCMSEKGEFILQIQDELRCKGYKHSTLRTALLNLMYKGRPYTVKELLHKLQKFSLWPNKTTVYRELDSLQKEGIIREFDLTDGKKRYELATENKQHYHLMCQKCGEIECFEMDDDMSLLNKMVTTKSGFQVDKHILEFFGLCAKCQA